MSAAGSKKVTALSAQTAPVAADELMIVSNTAGNAVSMRVDLGVLYANAAANVSVNVATTATLVVSGNSTPANNTDNDSRPAGSIWADGTYMYYYDGTEIKRLTLSTF